MGMGVYTDKKAENASRKVGSEFFNHIAGLLGSHVMKTMAKLHGCDVKTRQIFAASDVAGYNYGILRYQHDLKNIPNALFWVRKLFVATPHATSDLPSKTLALSATLFGPAWTIWAK